MTYDPLFILKPVGDEIWIVDGTAIKFYGLPFTTRMTVIRVDGDLFLHSPIAYSRELATELEKLGKIRWLIAPNWIHYAYVHDWQVAYPDGLCFAADGVAARAEKTNTPIRIDGALANNAMPWSSSIDTLNVEGSKIHRETVFFHRTSHTLIVTDLIENFENAHMPFWMRPITWAARIKAPYGRMPPDIRLSFRDRHALARAVSTMRGWPVENIILAHGACFFGNGQHEFERVFGWASARPDEP